MGNTNTSRRLAAVARKRARRGGSKLAVVDVRGMTPEEAERAKAEAGKGLARGAVLVVLDM